MLLLLNEMRGFQPKSVFEKIRRRDTKPMKHGSQKDPTEYKQ